MSLDQASMSLMRTSSAACFQTSSTNETLASRPSAADGSVVTFRVPESPVLRDEGSTSRDRSAPARPYRRRYRSIGAAIPLSWCSPRASKANGPPPPNARVTPDTMTSEAPPNAMTRAAAWTARPLTSP